MISDRIIECRKIIQSFAIAIAGVAAIPIPFADFFLMTPLQCAMVITIGRRYGRKINIETAKELVATIGGALVGRLICSTFIKMIPFVGGMISMPFAYGWTFGLGEMAILYFETKGTVSKEDLEKGFDRARKEGERSYKKTDIDINDALEAIKPYLSEEELAEMKEKIEFTKNTKKS